MSFILLDKEAYFYNLKLLTERVEVEKIILVMKDNAYGHGLLEMTQLAYDFGIENIAVRDTDEANQITLAFKRIIILSEKNNFLNRTNYEYVINNDTTLEYISKDIKIHLKVNTGMNRNGIDINNAFHTIDNIIKKNFNLIAILSHIHSADIDDNSMKKQIKDFKSLRNRLDKAHKKRLLYHIHNSSAFFRELNYNFVDFVRIGIASYGYVYLPNNTKMPNLKPVLSLWAEKMSSRIVKQDDAIGYNHIYKVKEDTIISTYDIGYSDGLIRLNYNQKVKLENKKYILGRISMDSVAINSNEDKVCIFDDAKNFAKNFDTISYDVLVKLSRQIMRSVK